MTPHGIRKAYCEARDVRCGQVTTLAGHLILALVLVLAFD